MMYLHVVIAKEIPNEPVYREVEPTAKEVNENHDLAGIGSMDVLTQGALVP